MRYSLPEVVELAVQTEKGGMLFYDMVGAETKDARLKELFRFLSDEEAKHLETFIEIGRATRPAPEEVPYNFEETTLYLRSIVDSRYFLGKDKALVLARESPTVDQAIGHAIGFEKETLLFYYEVLSMVSERNKGPVRAVIGQEREHIRKLQELRAAL